MDEVALGPPRADDLVDLVALGHTQHDYTFERRNKRSEQELPREVWSCNRGLLYLQADRGFLLDDLELERRQWARYIEGMRTFRGRLFVSRRVPELLPQGEAYPLADVVAELGPAHVYLHNSVPMMLAYALLVPWVQRIRVWGADYTTPAGGVLEADRANCEYMIAVCRERGLEVEVCETSTLCSANKPPRIYGYADQAAAWREVEKGLERWTANCRQYRPPGAGLHLGTSALDDAERTAAHVAVKGYGRHVAAPLVPSPLPADPPPGGPCAPCEQPPGGVVDDAPLGPLEASVDDIDEQLASDVAYMRELEKQCHRLRKRIAELEASGSS